MMQRIARTVRARKLIALAPLAVAAAIAWAAPATANAVTERFRPSSAGATTTVNHDAWDALLKKYVVAGEDGLNRVRYLAFKDSDHATLKSYVQSLERVKPTSLTRPEQFAFWVNLYNAKTIDIILDNYPVKTIRDIAINEGLVGFLKRSVGAGGPWKAKVVTVDGEALSLDNIEHDILRPVFKDPRVHYAVNCASIGCPNLQRSAFTAANQEALLEKGARDFVNSPRGFRFVDGGVWASSIYNWFKVDFGDTNRSVLAHAAKYADAERAAKLSGATDIASFGYDWSLNDAPSSLAPKTD